jgi:hypothetical protein
LSAWCKHFMASMISLIVDIAPFSDATLCLRIKRRKIDCSALSHIMYRVFNPLRLRIGSRCWNPSIQLTNKLHCFSYGNISIIDYWKENDCVKQNLNIMLWFYVFIHLWFCEA